MAQIGETGPLFRGASNGSARADSLSRAKQRTTCCKLMRARRAIYAILIVIQVLLSLLVYHRHECIASGTPVISKTGWTGMFPVLFPVCKSVNDSGPGAKNSRSHLREDRKVKRSKKQEMPSWVADFMVDPLSDENSGAGQKASGRRKHASKGKGGVRDKVKRNNPKAKHMNDERGLKGKQRSSTFAAPNAENVLPLPKPNKSVRPPEGTEATAGAQFAEDTERLKVVDAVEGKGINPALKPEAEELVDKSPVLDVPLEGQISHGESSHPNSTDAGLNYTQTLKHLEGGRGKRNASSEDHIAIKERKSKQPVGDSIASLVAGNERTEEAAKEAPDSQAFAILVGNCDMVEPAILSAQALRLTRTKFHIVLLLEDLKELDVAAADPRLPNFFTSVRRVPAIWHPVHEQPYGRLNAWNLTEYEKVVYLDPDVMVLERVDYLFHRPALAAAPSLYASHKFDAGLMVLQPSSRIFQEMLSRVKLEPTYDGTDQGFLNSFFPDWFALAPAHRLPFRHNAVFHFAPSIQPPLGFDLGSAHWQMGPLSVVHFAPSGCQPWAAADLESSSPSPGGVLPVAESEEGKGQGQARPLDSEFKPRKGTLPETTGGAAVSQRRLLSAAKGESRGRRAAKRHVAGKGRLSQTGVKDVTSEGQGSGYLEKERHNKVRKATGGSLELPPVRNQTESLHQGVISSSKKPVIARQDASADLVDTKEAKNGGQAASKESTIATRSQPVEQAGASTEPEAATRLRTGEETQEAEAAGFAKGSKAGVNNGAEAGGIHLTTRAVVTVAKDDSRKMLKQNRSGIKAGTSAREILRQGEGLVEESGVAEDRAAVNLTAHAATVSGMQNVAGLGNNIKAGSNERNVDDADLRRVLPRKRSAVVQGMDTLTLGTLSKTEPSTATKESERKLGGSKEMRHKELEGAAKDEPNSLEVGTTALSAAGVAPQNSSVQVQVNATDSGDAVVEAVDSVKGKFSAKLTKNGTAKYASQEGVGLLSLSSAGVKGPNHASLAALGADEEAVTSLKSKGRRRSSKDDLQEQPVLGAVFDVAATKNSFVGLPVDLSNVHNSSGKAADLPATKGLAKNATGLSKVALLPDEEKASHAEGKAVSDVGRLPGTATKKATEDEEGGEGEAHGVKHDSRGSSILGKVGKAASTGVRESKPGRDVHRLNATLRVQDEADETSLSNKAGIKAVAEVEGQGSGRIEELTKDSVSAEDMQPAKLSLVKKTAKLTDDVVTTRALPGGTRNGSGSLETALRKNVFRDRDRAEGYALAAVAAAASQKKHEESVKVTSPLREAGDNAVKSLREDPSETEVGKKNSSYLAASNGLIGEVKPNATSSTNDMKVSTDGLKAVLVLTEEHATAGNKSKPEVSAAATELAVLPVAKNDSNFGSCHGSVWAATWLRLRDCLVKRHWKPLLPKHFSIVDTAASILDDTGREASYMRGSVGELVFNSSRESKWLFHLKELPKPMLAPPSAPPSLVPKPPNPTAVFVTAAWDEPSLTAAAGLCKSFQQHHQGKAGMGAGAHPDPQIVLLVASTLAWKPLGSLFFHVEPVPLLQGAGAERGGELAPDFILLELWRLLSYERLVYVSPYGFFISDCSELLAMVVPFAAAPRAFPGDRFSSSLMVLQPYDATFQDMKSRILTGKYPHRDVTLFLNSYFHDWAGLPSERRIVPTYAVDVEFNPALMQHLQPWKILVFDQRNPPWTMNAAAWRSQDAGDAAEMWREAFCKLPGSQRPLLSCRGASYIFPRGDARALEEATDVEKANAGRSQNNKLALDYEWSSTGRGQNSTSIVINSRTKRTTSDQSKDRRKTTKNAVAIRQAVAE